jgi:hypothetical protein
MPVHRLLVGLQGVLVELLGAGMNGQSILPALNQERLAGSVIPLALTVS